MARVPPSAGKDFCLGLIAFLVPFGFLYRYVIPVPPIARAIGNDFLGLYYGYKVYLLDALSRGQLPFWSPSEAAGFPFYSNPFTQTFYPPNVLLAIAYKLGGGYSPYDHQVFTVMGIGIFAVGIYAWLRALDIAARHALVATLVISTSLKITEIVRFPNAVHTAAWLPFILWGCTRIARGDSRLRGWGIVFLSTTMMLTGGYLYYVYYAGFLIVPYALLLMCPGTRAAFLPGSTIRIGAYLLTVGSALLSALVLCAPYLLGVLRLLSQTVDRGGASFAYSTEHEFTVTDTVGSLLFPPASQMEGWYYFGMAGLLVVAAYSLLVFLREGEPSGDKRLLGILTAWYLLISYISYGKHSWLFTLLWDALPGFSSLRVWGRMNIILLPLLALLLAKAHAGLERLVLERPIRRWSLFLTLFAGLYAAIVAAQWYLYLTKTYDPYWTRYFLPSVGGRFDERVFIYAGGAAFLLLLRLMVWGRTAARRSPRLPHLLLGVLVGLNLYDTGSVGARQWSLPQPPSLRRWELRLDRMNLQALSTARRFEYQTISLSPRFSVGYVDNWYFQRYIGFLEEHGPPLGTFDGDAQTQAFKEFLGLTDGQRLYFTASLDHPSLEAFLLDARTHARQSQFRVSVERYTGDALRIRVGTTAQGYLSVIDNWDQDWTARLDGHPVGIDKPFGTFKAIRVEPGTHVVELMYRPLRWLAGVVTGGGE